MFSRLWNSSLTCNNGPDNIIFLLSTFLVRSPASDPRSESRAGFQDKFHLTPDPDTERAESRNQTSIWPDWSPHPVSEVTTVRCTWALTAPDANWITRLWFYNFHFYLSPRAKSLRIPQSCELNVKWNQNHSSDSWNVFRVLQRNISMHAIIGFALVYILYIFT